LAIDQMVSEGGSAVSGRRPRWRLRDGGFGGGPAEVDDELARESDRDLEQSLRPSLIWSWPGR
jgi:hypothetical protein